MSDKTSSINKLQLTSTWRCFLLLIILSAIFSIFSPYFLSFANLDNILAASVVIGLLALGSTFVISIGSIDLSVASVMALSGTVCAYFIKDNSYSSVWPFLICIFVGGVCGVLSGVLINITRAPSFVITLGMLSVARAVSFIVADGMPIYGLPTNITSFGQDKICGISISVFILGFASVIAYLILHQTIFGRQALLFGDNAVATEVMGIKINKLRLYIFALCGSFAGLAGFIFMSRTNAGDPTAGQNYELVAITAVILGGTKLFGGYATIFGSLLGALCLGVLQNGLNLLAVSTYYQVLLVGIVLISASFMERIGKKV